MSVKESDFTFIPASALAELPAGFSSVDVMRDYWWTMRGEDIAFYKGKYPQCNPNKVVSDKVSARYEWCTEVRQIPLVAIPFRTVEVTYCGESYGPEQRYVLPKAVSR